MYTGLNSFNSHFKAILVLVPSLSLYTPPFRVRSGEAASNCPVYRVWLLGLKAQSVRDQGQGGSARDGEGVLGTLQI